MSDKPPQRVGFFVDGFNLYYGLRDSGYRRFMWLDVHKLAALVLLPHQELSYSKYFTARISGGRPTDKPAYRAARNEKRKRQAVYLDALVAASGTRIFEGHFLDLTVKCNRCGAKWSDAEEKMTDVNIASELLVDSFTDQFYTAIVVSADSDLVPPIRAVRHYFSHKRIVVAFPPGRFSADLKATANGQRMIAKGHLKKNQLAEEITIANGYVLNRPANWI